MECSDRGGSRIGWVDGTSVMITLTHCFRWFQSQSRCSIIILFDSKSKGGQRTQPLLYQSMNKKKSPKFINMRDVSRINTPKESVDFTGYWFIFACCVRTFNCSGAGLSACRLRPAVPSTQFAIRTFCVQRNAAARVASELLIHFVSNDWRSFSVQQRIASRLFIRENFPKIQFAFIRANANCVHEMKSKKWWT